MVKSFEGLALRPYNLWGWVVSVGYGFIVSQIGEPFNLDMEPISEAEADALLLRDLESSEGWFVGLLKRAFRKIHFPL